MKKKVFVGMSGGVDSSVTALLLKKQGYDVVGCFIKGWYGNFDCTWKEDRRDAMRVCAKLDIPFITIDAEKEYKKEVVDYMIREYKAGRTPNPDVMCNRYIKFGVFLKKALEMGADYIATGHYVKLNKNKLLQAKDLNKDQSYFLWTLTQKQLKYCLFPIGNLTKPEVREIARKNNLSTAEKRDSQGVCFIGEFDIMDFLKKYIKPRKGKVINLENKIVGEHNGVNFYTIGQRHGLSRGGGIPYYIVAKDAKKNLLIVADKADEEKFYKKEV
ncbi:MAG: tRNA-specific 2-thiouridylase MnmA, partial [Parcubacteria group bacterium Athens0714_24]